MKEKKTGKKGAERRNYSKDFKAEALAAEKREKPLSRTAVDLGVDESLPRRRMRQAREAAQGGPPLFPDADAPGRGIGPAAEKKQGAAGGGRNTKKSGGRLRAERRPVRGYRFMREYKNPYRIRETAGVFGVSSSAYSRWAERGVSAGGKERDAELLGRIRKLRLRHHRRYGSPRVPEALRDD